MARYVTSIDSPRDPEELFAYLSDFANAKEWDPGVVDASRAGTGPVQVGTEFRLVAAFMGRKVPITYAVTALDPPRSVTFRGENASVVSLDTISFEPRGGGTRVTYDADLRLKGPARLADPVLKLAFNRIGDAAAAGLRGVLEGRPVAAA
jgi:carbon monoxide dehydrogenase subunit G